MMNSGLRRLLSGAVALMLLGCSSALADTATVTARKLILREKASSTSGYSRLSSQSPCEVRPSADSVSPESLR